MNHVIFKLCKQWKNLFNNIKKFVWPDHIKCKDINDMVMGGLDSDEIINIINESSASGLEAQIRINKWKKT